MDFPLNLLLQTKESLSAAKKITSALTSLLCLKNRLHSFVHINLQQCSQPAVIWKWISVSITEPCKG